MSAGHNHAEIEAPGDRTSKRALPEISAEVVAVGFHVHRDELHSPDASLGHGIDKVMVVAEGGAWTPEAKSAEVAKVFLRTHSTYTSGNIAGGGDHDVYCTKVFTHTHVRTHTHTGSLAPVAER